MLLPDPAVEVMTAKLFDCSHWNVTADFTVAKAAGYTGVYLKATQGPGYTDPTFAVRVKAAKAAGLHVGAYLFLEPDKSPVDQAKLFVQVAGASCDLRPALDHETAPSGMAAGDIAHVAVLAAAALKTYGGVTPLLYTYRSFITAGFCAGLGGYPLWIADYTVGATAPTIPPGPWKSWVMWQTGQATVPGVSGGDGPGTDVNVAPSLTPLFAHPPVTPAGDTPLLAIGATGPKVTDVQHALDPLDPRNLTAHTDGLGHFGQRTRDVLRVFQQHRGLAATGTTTPATWAALRDVAHP